MYAGYTPAHLRACSVRGGWRRAGWWVHSPCRGLTWRRRPRRRHPRRPSPRHKPSPPRRPAGAAMVRGEATGRRTRLVVEEVGTRRHSGAAAVAAVQAGVAMDRVVTPAAAAAAAAVAAKLAAAVAAAAAAASAAAAAASGVSEGSDRVAALAPGALNAAAAAAAEAGGLWQTSTERAPPRLVWAGREAGRRLLGRRSTAPRSALRGTARRTREAGTAAGTGGLRTTSGPPQPVKHL